MDNVSKVCPDLGMADDPDTHTSYPSKWNYCQHLKSVAGIEFSHQSDYCLSENHQNCPVFLQKTKSSLPFRLRGHIDQNNRRQSFGWKKILIIITLIIILSSFIGILLLSDNFIIPTTGNSSFQKPARENLIAAETKESLITPTVFENIEGINAESMELSKATVAESPAPKPSALSNNSFFSLSATDVQSPTPYPFATNTPENDNSPTHVPTQLPTITQIPTPTIATSTPIPKSTSAPTPQHYPRELDSPIGNQFHFIIHQIKNGDSLNYYAARYKTSLEAIIRINYSLLIPLWVGSFIVIPVDLTEVVSMPYFQPFRLMTGAMTVAALAQELGTDFQKFIYFNDFDPDEVVMTRDWILVPRPDPAK
jgi:hypothetical protein